MKKKQYRGINTDTILEENEKNCIISFIPSMSDNGLGTEVHVHHNRVYY